MFEHIQGHDAIKLYLCHALQRGRLPHALLLSGPQGIGKHTLAVALAHEMLGAKSRDLHLLEPDTKSGLYSIDLIQTVLAIVQKAPFEHKAKVVLFDRAEKLVPPAAHALLKTLEEPPPDSYFILIASRPEELLPTLRSRCIEQRCTALSESMIYALLQQHKEGEASQFRRAARLAQGSYEQALMQLDETAIARRKRLFHALANQQRLDEEEVDAEMVLSDLLGWFRDQLLYEVQGDPSLCLYPDAPRLDRAIPHDLQEIVEETHLALIRQIKPSVCLDALFRSLQAKIAKRSS